MELHQLAGLITEVGAMPIAVLVGWWRLSHLEKSLARQERRLDAFMKSVVEATYGCNR